MKTFPIPRIRLHAREGGHLRCVLELDWTGGGGELETVVVRPSDDPCGAFVAGKFIPFLKTIEGWAFVHGASALEMTESDVWVEGSLLGVPARAMLVAETD